LGKVNDNWYPDDKLGRKESADFLTSYLIKRYALPSSKADSFVLNIRADWGFGKTFFLQHWAVDLENKGFPVVFFNAWENDFCDDPLIGFIAELNDRLSRYFENIPLAQRHLDQALAVGRKLIKPVSLGIASAIAKQLSGLSLEKLQELYFQDRGIQDEIEGGGEQTSDSISTLLSQYGEIALKEHLNTKETITLFRKRLARLIDSLKQMEDIQLPLFIFIDELDRCRPTFAIELLEVVKHLFGVPGVYFVVATNLEQLGHSIRAVYGEQFDAERYLKRFFDQEYLLPTPDNIHFSAFLFDQYSLNKFGAFHTCIENGIYGATPSDQMMFSIMSDSFKLGPRDQKQVAEMLQAVLLNWPKNEFIHLDYLLFLIIAKHISTYLFQQLAENQFSDSATFTTALASKLKSNSKFKTHDVVTGGSMVTEQRIVDLLWTYQSISNMTCKELWDRDYNTIKFPDKILDAVRQGCPRQYPSSVKPVPAITDYARRISQAGQLTNIQKK
jgi:hypothetical protein